MGRIETTNKTGLGSGISKRAQAEIGGSRGDILGNSEESINDMDDTTGKVDCSTGGSRLQI